MVTKRTSCLGAGTGLEFDFHPTASSSSVLKNNAAPCVVFFSERSAVALLQGNASLHDRLADESLCECD